jgi:hypothetical protein
LTGTQLYSSRNSIDEFTRIEIDEEVRLIKSYDRMASFENKSIPLDVTMPPSILAEWIISEMRTVPWRRELAWLRDAAGPIEAVHGEGEIDLEGNILKWYRDSHWILLRPYRIDVVGVRSRLNLPSQNRKTGDYYDVASSLEQGQGQTYKPKGYNVFDEALIHRIPLSPDAEVASEQAEKFMANLLAGEIL